MLVLLRDRIEERAFPDWSMGFREVGAADLQGVAGYSDFMGRPFGSDHGDSAPAAYRRRTGCSRCSATTCGSAAQDSCGSDVGKPCSTPQATACARVVAPILR